VNSTEAIQGQAKAQHNMIRNMDDLVRQVSLGVTETGKPGTRATELEYQIYRISARYENAEGPPRIDLSTNHRFFWSEENLNKIQVMLEKLLVEGIPFVTMTGDGSAEYPKIVLKWERENRVCAIIK